MKTTAVIQDLAERLKSREWPQGSMLPPRAVLSAHYDVSPATISNAIATLKGRRLLKSVPGKGVFVTVPSADGKGAAAKMPVIALAGVYLPEGEQLRTLNHASIDRIPIISELYAASRVMGSPLVMLPNSDDHVDVDLLSSLGVDGLILLGGYPREELLKLVQTDIPAVLGNDPREPLPLSFVDYDNEGSMRETVERFVSLGHERIGYIGLETSVKGYIDHLRTCFVQNLLEKGICFNFHDYWCVGSYARAFRCGPDQLAAIGEELVGKLFDREEPPTAVYCAQQQLLAGVKTGLAKRGLRVPDDVSLMTCYDFCDESDVSGLVHPRQELSQGLLETLLKKIDDPSYFSQRKLQLPFLDRGTIKKLG
ncbi:substrate-binding domain-containing protein [Phycisphaerales bacterium AB-hyl4]|uniref:Substrate-binding domain-containing protein n=1 Tax=Natronomicrosphaera hydrolytica TaxID=3242702 RepID=A0ABV4U1D4_9BACT